MYVPKSVLKPQGKISPGAPMAKSPNLMIIETDKIVSEPERDNGGVKMIGNYEFVEGYEPIQVYLTASTQVPHYDSDGDEDAISISQDFVGEHPGNSLEIRELVQNLLGKNVILISGSCQSKHYDVYGTKCAPLQLKPELTADNDKTSTALTFEQFQKTAIVPGYYEGALPTGNIEVVGDATTVTLKTDDGMIYKLPSDDEGNEIDFSTIDLDNGAVVTLIGNGGDTPSELKTTATGATVLLKDGTTWVAATDARIDLEYFNDGSKDYLVERRRY